MGMSTTQLTLGTRKSMLALWQARHVATELQSQHSGLSVKFIEVVTQGDTIIDRSLPAIGGKGLFTAELEAKLISGEIDIAVHSLKDLPTENPEGLTIGAILPRAPHRDVLITQHGCTFAELPPQPIIGTSSPRRERQLRRLRSDIICKDIRGNVDTRIKKVRDGLYHATVLAEAGLSRLGLLHEVSYFFPCEELVSAPGQGALAVQCREDDHTTRESLKALHHDDTAFAVSLERGFLSGLGAGCSTPVGAYATKTATGYSFIGRIASLTDSSYVEVRKEITEERALTAELGWLTGITYAQEALARDKTR
jgi:hydroxymethylbilane synthase